MLGHYIKCLLSSDGGNLSEKAGIIIEGDNKWLTLMRNAIQYQKARIDH